jgi:hypothetical protein
MGTAVSSGEGSPRGFSQTMVTEKPEEVRVRPHDFAAYWFSITILERDFSNPALGDGFREGKTRWNRASD